CIGIPNIGGETFFDDSYNNLPLVNVLATGIVHKDKIKTAKAIADCYIILIGSATGKDGLHGASFASKELENNHENKLSIQIADPFMGKLLMESSLEIMDIPEVIACQDCGAAGILSTTSEMAYKGNCGVELYLDKVHTQSELLSEEIMLSETQERMVFAVQKCGIEKIKEITNKHQLPMSVVGKTTIDKGYRLFLNDELVANVTPEILNEPPTYKLKSASIKKNKFFKHPNSKLTAECIKKVIASPNFASKKSIFEQYDYMIGNRTAIKPTEFGSSGVWLFENDTYISLNMDSNPLQVYLNPYNGAINTVLESYRNAVANGFEPKAITNCLNFSSPENPEIAYQLENSIKGITKACKELNIPVVSGNVSLYNEIEGRKILPTPVIGMLGHTNSHKNIIRTAFKENETVYVIGNQIDLHSDIGGSVYFREMHGFLSGKVANSNIKMDLKLQNFLFSLRDKDILKGCNDISKFGILGALFESLRAGNVGFIIDDNTKLINEIELFGEIQTRYLISVCDMIETENYLKKSKIPFKKIGVCSGKMLDFRSFKIEIKELFEIFDNSLYQKVWK
ncbi:MAG: AIR synthase-related protein, partial [Candidatus Gastranaerophilales bacterium]|nr:AIR synthase-related protein [Candidatus Gastranaerophilales bacterium]